MARVDKLSNFLTDVANSIRNKKETTGPILASDFDNEINSLSSKYSPRHIAFASYGGTELNDEFSRLDLSKVTSMKYMFYVCTNLENIDLGDFDASNVTNMYYSFNGCTNLKTVKIDKFNTKNVINMGGLFSDCTSLEELDLTNFDTSNVTSLYRAFFGCTNLKKLNLSTWNTSKVTDFRYMFSNCKKLERLDIRNFDFSSIDSNGDYCMFSGLNTACLIIVKNETVKTWIYKRLSYAYTVKTVAELTEEEM